MKNGKFHLTIVTIGVDYRRKIRTGDVTLERLRRVVLYL